MATKLGRALRFSLRSNHQPFMQPRNLKVRRMNTSHPPSVASRTRRPLFSGSQPEQEPFTPDRPPPSTARQESTQAQAVKSGITPAPADEPVGRDESGSPVDWAKSFSGLSSQPFDKEAAAVLLADIPFDDVEVKPDGIIYLPEIKYRRILNKAFGPGGWGLAPRGPIINTGKSITREYALVAHGRLVSVALGEMAYYSPDSIPTATEGCKSNAMMRCCKDLGVASQLWDPRYIRTFMKEKAKQIWVEHLPTKKKKQVWLRKDDEVKYPYKETK